MKASFLLLVSCGLACSIDLGLPLNRLPMVGSHDSMTGYLTQPSATSPAKDLEMRWAITQKDASLAKQLDCGARNFDLRPHASNNSYPEGLVAHHGSVVIDTSFVAAMKEVADWAATADTSTDNLIWLNIWDTTSSCYGKVDNMTRRALSDAGIPLVESCDKLFNLTIGSAMSFSKLSKSSSGRGNVIASLGCHDDPPGWTTYDCPALTCVGFNNPAEEAYWDKLVYNCSGYGGSGPIPPGIFKKILSCADVVFYMKTHSTFDCGSSTASKKQTALDRLLSFNTNLTNLPLPVDATGNLHYLYTIDAVWAATSETAVAHALEGGSLIDDVAWSGIHSKFAQWILDGKFQNLPNVVLANDVCNGGQQILDALRNVSRATYLTQGRPGVLIN